MQVVALFQLVVILMRLQSCTKINSHTPIYSTGTKTVTYKIEFGGKSLELVGDQINRI
jgi:hypothetical protein